MTDVINTVVGLVVGLLTGYFFERRATRATRIQNRELEEQLKTLREGVYSVGGHVDSERELAPMGDALPHEVESWVVRAQDLDGRVSKGRLVGHFMSNGFTTDAIEEALAELVAQGAIRVVDRWVEVVR